MSEKDIKNPEHADDESWGGLSLIPDDMNPYENNDPSIVLPPEGTIDPADMQVLVMERDVRNARFRNLIAKGRHMLALGIDAAAEKYFQKAAEEGYHEANFQIAILRINRLMQETEAGRGADRGAGRGPDSRDAEKDVVPGRRTMRRDLVTHFELLTDSVFRYADDHMILQTKEILEKAASAGLVDNFGPEEAERGYKKILMRHSESTWEIVNYDESSAMQNFMVLLSVCRNADRYDMSWMLGVLLFKLEEFMATGEFEEFSEKFRGEV